MPIPVHTLDPYDVVFTHNYEGVTRTWCISRMELKLRSLPASGLGTPVEADGLTYCPVYDPSRPGVPLGKYLHVGIDPDFAEHCMRERGIEQHRLQPLIDMPYKLFEMLPPVIYTDERDGDWKTLLDGHHRYVAAHRKGLKSVRSFIGTYAFTDQFLVSGLPDVEDGYQHSFSGIPSGHTVN